jgi:hypothetical protein
MAAKLTRQNHKIAIQLHLVAESCTICNSRSRRPVRKLLDTLSYNPSVHNRGHKTPPMAPILSQMNPVHTFPPYFSMIHFPLSRLLTRTSAQVRGPVWHFVPSLFFYGEKFLAPRPTPKLSATAYSIYIRGTLHIWRPSPQIRNPRTHHGVVTVTHIIMSQI